MERLAYPINEIDVIREQEAFSELLLDFNEAMATGSEELAEAAKEKAHSLISSPFAGERVVDEARAIYDHLDYNFWVSTEGLYHGRDLEPEGYPENYVFYGNSMEFCENLPDNSIDGIVTDVPYVQGQMDTVDWLGHLAGRVLKDDGFMITNMGNIPLADGIVRLSKAERIRYFLTYTILHQNGNPHMWARNTDSACKFVLVYRKVGSKAVPNHTIDSVYRGDGIDKDHHHWGQPVEETEHFLKAFTKPGDLILEPFAGGGTTAVACANTNRRCIAFELDQKHAATAQSRLYENQYGK